MNIKVLGLYRNNRNGKFYRVLNILQDQVLYISQDGQLWVRPVSEWFGLNRNGDVRFTLVENDDHTIAWYKEA